MSEVFPDNLEDQMVWLVHRVADLERRSRNRKRTGKIAQVDAEKGLARVELSKQGDKPYLSPWLPWKEHSAGTHKTHYPPSVGEQVEIASENGDLTDAVIDRAVNSDDNPRPSSKGDEYVLSKVGDHDDRVSDGGATRTIKLGNSTLVMTKDKSTLSVGGSSIVITDGEITIKSGSIKFEKS